jgi:mannosyltransferase
MPPAPPTGPAPIPKPSPREVAVIVPHFKHRATGVTATVVALVPVLARRVPLACLGPGLPADLPRLTPGQLLRLGWSAPAGRPFRIWHARRNVEMLGGVLVKRLLGQKVRLVFTSAAQRPHRRWTRFLLRQMDAVIATSRFAGAWLKVPHEIVLHGVDTERFRPAADRAAAWRATGLPGRHGIGIAGRIRPQKGTDLFVEAMIALLPARPDWTAVILGRAMPEHQAFLDGLKARIAAAGLSDRIRFLGSVPDGELAGWYRALSILVAPPRNEGFGLTPLEAMASGTPVVASCAGAFPDIIADGETGLLVPIEDAPGLRAAVAALIEDPARREAMGAAARGHVVARFGIGTEAAAILAVYERLWREG